MSRAWILCALLVVLASATLNYDDLSLLEILSPEDYPLAVLPPLPFDYNALEPYIATEIMQIHHDKHHQAYVTNYNKAITALVPALVTGNFAQVTQLQLAINFNGGGHINHCIFWTNLAPTSTDGGKIPGDGSPLTTQVTRDFGSYDNLIAAFVGEAAEIQGSGWAWLAYDATTKALSIQTTPNQNPLEDEGYVPLLGIDMWEHSYYLQYQNNKTNYLSNIWNVVNWTNVQERFVAATQNQIQICTDFELYNIGL